MVGGTYVPSATGGASGNPVNITIDAFSTSVCSMSGPVVTFNHVGNCVIDAYQAGNADFLAAPQAQQMMTVGTASVALTWATPAAITYGTPLTATQLDATASVPGTFSYDPPAGTILQPGTSTLTATFTPTDTTDYTGGIISTQITVTQAPQAITFTSTPPASPVVGGTYVVSATGGASGNPVTFVINAPSTSVCSISGSVVTFDHPGSCVIDAYQDGNADYLLAQARQTLTVGKATPPLSWATVPSITFGTPLTGKELDATASVPGTFSYSPPAGHGPAARHPDPDGRLHPHRHHRLHRRRHQHPDHSRLQQAVHHNDDLRS